MTGVTTGGMIDVITNATTATMIGVMIDVAKTTTIAMTTTVRSTLHHHHHLKGTTLMVRFNQPAERSTLSSVITK
jgi:hypothetical protein